MSQKIDINDIRDIMSNVKRGHLKKAFEVAKRCAAAYGFWQQLDTLATHERTYRAMMQYIDNDNDSNARHKSLAVIKEYLLSIADELRLKMDIDSPRPGHESDLYTAAIRTRLFMQPKSMLQLMEEIDETESVDISYQLINRLFTLIATTQHLTRQETVALRGVLDNHRVDEVVKAMILSALGIGILYYYDSNKLSLLIEKPDFNTDMLEARRLCGIFMAIWRHPSRIALDPALTEKIKELADNNPSKGNISSVAMAFVGSRDTERINEKMQKDIIPELKRIQSDFIRRFPGGMDMRELMDPEKNPEWEELLQNSSLTESMQELGDIQSQGGDVLMFAFSNLKNFSFFNSVGNWLLPFSADHPELRQTSEENEKILSVIADSADFLCDPDKYSLCLAMNRMPRNQGRMILNQMQQQFEQYREDKATSLQKSLEAPLKVQITLYVRSLSRLCSLYPRKGLRLPNPFSKAIIPSLLPGLGEYFTDYSLMTAMSEFLFSRGYYSEVLPLLQEMEKEDDHNAMLKEKIGFALQQLSDTQKALDYYKRAENLLANPGEWLIRKLATLYRAVGEHDKAVHYWRLIADKNPDDIKTATQLANSLFDSGEMEEALKYYYKVEYLSGGMSKTWRPIAWCEFQLGNFEKSQSYYDRLLKSGNDASDLLNAAHLAIARGDLDLAISLYKNAVHAQTNGLSWVLEQLSADSNILARYGFNSDSMELLADRLSYECEA